MTDQPTPPLHEQVRTLEADLVMCREQLAQETERAEKAEKMATSPGSPLVQQADTYRRMQQADAEEELIEKAARTLAFAAERNDDGVTESEMWETYLIRESRRKYLDHARALHRAGLLQGGDEK